MSSNPFEWLLSNTWAIFLIVLFFGGSIFVHELGHYLAARARGVKVEVFSIGMGPAMVSWKGPDGTKYQIAWIPLGGFVLLPQLADLGPLEGESELDVAALPPIPYGSKLLVFFAGAAFNVIFAFALACIIFLVGQPENAESVSTTVGYVARTLDLPDGSKVASPASQAGLQVGDVVMAIDGHKVTDWDELNGTLVMGSGHDPKGGRSTVFTVEREGNRQDVTIHPILSGDEKLRRVGIMPGYELDVHAVKAGSLVALAGLRPGDRVVGVNGAPIMNWAGLSEELAISPQKPATLGLLRAGKPASITLPARAANTEPLADIEYATGYRMTHPSPFTQIWEPFMMTIRTVWGLINPLSDIGLSKVSGPVGIVHNFHMAAEAGIRTVLRLTILINVNLAIINLLPIPILDGGQIAFATIGRLRGRQLPANVIATTQSVFVVLLLSLVLYISFFDVRRWSRDARESRAAATAPATPAH